MDRTERGKNDKMLRKLIVNWTLGVESFNIREAKKMVIISELILMRNNAAVTQSVDSPEHIYSRKEKNVKAFVVPNKQENSMGSGSSFI